jgi:hypothetical protein
MDSSRRHCLCQMSDDLCAGTMIASECFSFASPARDDSEGCTTAVEVPTTASSECRETNKQVVLR